MARYYATGGTLLGMKAAWLAALAVTVIGCASKPVASPAPPQTRDQQAKPQESLYEQLHSAFFQVDATVQSLSGAADVAQGMEGRAKGDLIPQIRDVVAALNYNGGLLQELAGGDAPNESDVAKDAAKFAKLREDLAKNLNLTLKDVREMLPFISDLALNGPPNLRADAVKLVSSLEGAVDDLLGALHALGAAEDGKQDEPDTADTNQKPPPGFTTG